MGLGLAEYEAMTPAEFVLVVRARRWQTEQRRKERETELYLLAGMTGAAVWGKLETFDAIFGREAADEDTMTDEQMLAQVRALNAAFGGANSFDEKGVRR